MNMKSRRNVDKMSLASIVKLGMSDGKKRKIECCSRFNSSRYVIAYNDQRVFAYAIPEYLHVPTTYSVMNDMT